MDNLLRGLADKLESACGDARAFVKEDEEVEYASNYSEVKKMLPNNMQKIHKYPLFK